MTELSALSLFPPFLTIVAAFVSRKIIPSLLLGILSGTWISSNFELWQGVKKASQIIYGKSELSHLTSLEVFWQQSWNLYIVFFCLILGSLIGLFYCTGGAYAYGEWVAKKVKSKRGASLATMGLGSLIFFDDYFNCLTVGAVMRPVSDRFRISRAKLAFLIDSTTAPVCILAPLSTWVIEVMTQLKTAGIGSRFEGSPFEVFMGSILFNGYAWATLLLVFWISWTSKDFGPMAKKEFKADQDGDVGAFEEQNQDHKSPFQILTKNSFMIDLTLPLSVMIVLILIFMQGTGGSYLLGGKRTIFEAFQNMHAAKALFSGGILTLIFSILFYTLRGRLTLKQIGTTLIKSAQAMLPVVLTLILAWSLGQVISDELKTGAYIAHILSHNFPVPLLPALIFLVSCLISLSTGTSWGTFAIMIPITVPLAFQMSPVLLIPMVAALLGGAVYGDHTSPISDTTILSSLGAGVNHMDHVLTQSPYSALVAVVSFLGYVFVGFLVTEAVPYASLVYLVFCAAMVLLLFQFFVSKTSSRNSS